MLCNSYTPLFLKARCGHCCTSASLVTQGGREREGKAAVSREQTGSPIMLSIQLVRLSYQIKQQHEHHAQNSSAQGPTSQSQRDARSCLDLP